MSSKVIILGAGVTGLGAGFASGLPLYEVAEVSGGICSSYYMHPDDNGRRLYTVSKDEQTYRFEIGGGHWIFGGDPLVLRFIRSLTPLKSYVRKSAVYIRDRDLLIPYPIQNHLRYLGQKLAAKSLQEIVQAKTSNQSIVSMADWLRASFGSTLCELFFDPFHKLYTAGLWKSIAPQDAYKSPVNLSLCVQGALDEAPSVGYNTTFVYPIGGLNKLAQQMAAQCDIHYGKRVVHIDVENREVHFEDGSAIGYETLLSTLPLNQMMDMTGGTVDEEPNPSPSVLVINIGAIKGVRCPQEHWVYVPKSKAGFHRVGFYSNVDASFLPAPLGNDQHRVSIYVEKAYLEGQKPSKVQLKTICDDVVKELEDWGWIKEAEIVDPTWIDVAYTWSWPGSRWTEKAVKLLEEHKIYQVGRFACWTFQGIADSIRDGLMAGAAVLNKGMVNSVCG